MSQPDPRTARSGMQERATLLELIYDSVADVIDLLSVEPGDVYRFESVNRAFLAATGLTREQVVGRRVDEALPESLHALVLGNYRRAIDERRRVDWEEVAVYPAGTKVGEVNVAPIFDAAGDARTSSARSMTSASDGTSRSSSVRPRRWRPLAGSRAASPTTSTTR